MYFMFKAVFTATDLQSDAAVQLWPGRFDLSNEHTGTNIGSSIAAKGLTAIWGMSSSSIKPFCRKAQTTLC